MLRVAQIPTGKPTVLDLFAGAGGMTLGLHDAGFHSVVAVDHNPVAVETLEANFGYLGTTALLRDLAIFKPAELKRFLKDRGLPQSFDVIVGGPPCQGFSKVGRAKLRSLKGFEGNTENDFDPRNDLYRNFLQFIQLFQPKVVVMENVPGMLSYRGRNMAEEIAAEIARPGYVVGYKVLNASDYGVPQHRERLFFVGVRNDLGASFQFPEAKLKNGKRAFPLVTVGDAIGDLPRLQNGAREWVSDYKAAKTPSRFAVEMRRTADKKSIFDHVCRQQNEQDIAAFRLMKQGGKYADLPAKYKRYRDDIFDDKYRRLYVNKPSWTVTAHLSRDCYSHIHPTQARTISVREAARIQSFPDSFYLGGNLGDKFQLVGNAVAPLMARTLGRAILEQFFSTKAKSLNSSARARKEKLNEVNA